MHASAISSTNAAAQTGAVLGRNIEIKARLDSLARARERARGLCDGPPEIQHQVDTYFHCRSGRLKLRQLDQRAGQLVWYERSDAQAARTSDYHLLPLVDAQAHCRALGAALGVRARVEKRREIYLWKNVRIHLDRVAGLGDFLEFEAVLDGVDEAAGEEQVRFLAEAFGIAAGDLIESSYGDMMSEINHAPRGGIDNAPQGKEDD